MRPLLLVVVAGGLFLAAHRSECRSDRIHVHYYGWYQNPETDGQWSHWDHAILPRSGPSPGSHKPPEEIGSPFYPELGLYSSHDPSTIRKHLAMMAEAGIGVVNYSWWGKDRADDRVAELMVREAEKVGLQVNFHIEPYPGREAASVREDLTYLIGKYGDSTAFYRDPTRGNLPMFYLYDSYLTPTEEWATILTPGAEDTIRGTDLDAILIGLYVKERDKELVTRGGFDGYYTYFATEGFTEGSTPSNWKDLSAWIHDQGKIFIPSVGPGYDDLPIRPWNERNLRGREAGKYYSKMFEAAVEAEPDFISITSFNEWHEGTQIEPAVPTKFSERTYQDYLPLDPDAYLNLTREWVDRFDPDWGDGGSREKAATLE